MKRLFALLLLPALLGSGCLSFMSKHSDQTSSVIERDIQQNGLFGLYLVPEDATEPLPGIVLVHEWWGLNQYIKDEAKKLSEEGYAVFAIDLYDGEVASSSARAGELAGSVRANPEAALTKMRAAIDFLQEQPEVQRDRLAGFGWCFGGAMENLLASSGEDRLKANVVYYGTPVTNKAALARMTKPTLGIWGRDDQSIPVDQVNAFEQALKDQGTPVEFHIYDGAGHAFANPTRGEGYRPEATADAWHQLTGSLLFNITIFQSRPS